MKTIKYGGNVVSEFTKFTKKYGLPEPKNWHLPKHKYTGPFTDLSIRLNEDGTPKPGFEPYNQIDEIAMHHDACYSRADAGESTRKECDKKMLDELDAVKTKGIREKIDYAVVKPIIWIKHKLGLGLEEAEELHKPIRHKFKRRRVMVYNVDDIWSADLTNSFQSLAKQNNGCKYMLNVIDLFSKYAYSIPLKSKNSDEIIAAFDNLFKSRRPKKLWTDRGTEFTNNKFKEFLKSNNIELYHVYNEGKACVIERFNRTLGEMIQKHLTSTQSTKYVDVLQELIHEYNTRTHSTIKMSPHDASLLENKVDVSKAFSTSHSKEKPKFKVGDRVRIYRYKKTFEKGYKPNWTKEIFVITTINKTNPITYEIKDLNEEPILGSFYSQELSKTKL